MPLLLTREKEEPIDAERMWRNRTEDEVVESGLLFDFFFVPLLDPKRGACSKTGGGREVEEQTCLGPFSLVVRLPLYLPRYYL